MTSPDPTHTIEAMREPSPLEAALERVGDRWSLLLVEALLGGPRRFNELGEAVPGIAPNILTDRLRRLERERIVVATPYQERPPRMSYALTADGQDLASALRLLADWGATTDADARADPPRPVRDAARDPLVLPDLRPGGGRPRCRGDDELLTPGDRPLLALVAAAGGPDPSDEHRLRHPDR